MRFEFSCKETDGGIGFEAKGCGLGYRYDGRTLTLDVLHLCMRRPLLLLDLGPVFPRNPLLYAEFLEKAAQINALLYSSNQTLNLCETIHVEKLVPVIWQLAKTAELAHDVELKNYKAFSESVGTIHEVQTFRLDYEESRYGRDNPYRLTLKTHSGTEIRASGAIALLHNGENEEDKNYEVIRARPRGQERPWMHNWTRNQTADRKAGAGTAAPTALPDVTPRTDDVAVEDP